uniref:BED-type domain-containing protein n=1 Tax=Lactuca sativa TaxID=4236 RepID=A0A9R1W5H9_LACSA|nr:hypothetical protein LSAT_V11C200096930 [Lactuca sativa]
MTSKNSTSPSVESTATATHKRNYDDIGWEYGFCPNKNKLDKVKCNLCGKVVSGGISRIKQHIAHVTGNVSSCPNSTKDDQLRIRNYLNEGKLNKIAKRTHDESLRSEVMQELHNSVDVDEIEDFLGSKAPNVISPMDDFANKINPEEALKKGKGKKVDLSNIVRKDRVLACHKFISRWAYKVAIPFHALEDDSCTMMLEVVGQFGTGLPPPTIYSLSDPLLKLEVERHFFLKRNEEEW